MIILELLHFHDLSTLPKLTEKQMHHTFPRVYSKVTKEHMNTCRKSHVFFLYIIQYSTLDT